MARAQRSYWTPCHSKVRQDQMRHFCPRIDIMYPMISRKPVGVSNENWGMSRWGKRMVSANRSAD